MSAGGAGAIRRVAISSGAQVASTLVAGVVTVALVRLLTTSLGTSGYGEYVTLFSLSAGAALLVDLGVSAQTVLELTRHPERASSIISRTIAMRAGMALLAGPATVGVAWALYPGQRGALLTPAWLFAIDVLATAVQTSALTWFGGRVRGEVIAGFTLVGRLGFFAAVLAVAASSRLDLARVAACYVGVDAATAIVAIGLVARRPGLRLRVELRAWVATLVAAAPFGGLQLLSTLYLYLDTLLVSVISGRSQVAYYGLGSSIFAVLGSIAASFSAAIAPNLATATRAVASSTVRRAVYAMTVVGSPLAVGGVVLAGPAVELLGGRRFGGAVVPFTLLSASLLPTFLRTVHSYAASATARPLQALRVAALALAVNVGCNVAFIPPLGARGAAISFVVSEVVAAGVLDRASRRSLGPTGAGDLWKPLVAALAAAGAGALVMTALPAGVVTRATAAGAAMATTYLATLLCVRGVPPEVRALLGRGGRGA